MAARGVCVYVWELCVSLCVVCVSVCVLCVSVCVPCSVAFVFQWRRRVIGEIAAKSVRPASFRRRRRRCHTRLRRVCLPSSRLRRP